MAWRLKCAAQQITMACRPRGADRPSSHLGRSANILTRWLGGTGGSRSVKPSYVTLREGENHWGPVNERLCFSETRFLHFHSDPLRCSRLLVRASHSYLGILVSAMIGDSWIGVSMLRAATLGEYVCVGPSWLGPDTNVLCVNGLG